LGENPIRQPEEIINSLQKYKEKKEYTSSECIEPLNNILKEMYNSKNIIVGNGLKELIFILQLAFNGIIIHITPSWVSYKEQILAIDKSEYLVEIETNIKNKYKLDLNILENKLIEFKSYPKLIIFNNPCNPTGLTYSNNEIKKISIILKKYNCIVFADEIYKNLVFDNEIDSISKYIPELTIIGSSISKDIGCGGYRLGWLIFPESLKELFKTTIGLASSIYSCVATPIQYATYEMLKNKNQRKKHFEYSIKIFNI
jgi:aspartate aminotransferase